MHRDETDRHLSTGTASLKEGKQNSVPITLSCSLSHTASNAVAYMKTPGLQILQSTWVSPQALQRHNVLHTLPEVLRGH